MAYLSPQDAGYRFAGPLPAYRADITGTEQRIKTAHEIMERVFPDVLKLMDLCDELAADGVVDVKDAKSFGNACPSFEDIKSRLECRFAEI